MPWIDRQMCIGCGSCVDECLAGAISMNDGTASIDEGRCIRCGICHDVCPGEAVRHDSERLPQEVEANVAWVKELLAHDYYLDEPDKQRGLIRRMARYFAKNKRVAEQTMARLEQLAS